MEIIIIHADGIWFTTFVSGVVASLIYLALHLVRLSTLIGKLLARSSDAPRPQPDASSQPTLEKATPELPDAMCDPLGNAANKEASSIKRRWSIPTNARATWKSIGLTRSRSFMWRSHAAPIECQQAPPPSLSHKMPMFNNPFNRDEQDSAAAARPLVQKPVPSPFQKSAAIGTDALSATKECHMQDREGQLHPSSDMENPTRTTLAGPVDPNPPPVDTTASPAQSRSRRRVKGPRPRPASMYAAVDGDGQRRYAQPARPENSLPCEIFERRFENPFRPRSRSVTLKGEKGTASDTSSQASGTSRRRSVLGMLSTFRRSLVKKPDGDDSARDVSPSSLRSSASSTAGTSFSSTSSKSKWSFCMRNGVPRTDPYGPPYFAQPPVSADANRRGRRA